MLAFVEGVRSREVGPRKLDRRPGDPARITLRYRQHTERRLDSRIVREGLERSEIIRPISRWTADPLFPPRDQPGIHPDPRHPALPAPKGKNHPGHTQQIKPDK